MDTYKAYRIDKRGDDIVAGFQELPIDTLGDGDVLVKVTHSSINYKDALAATGSGQILRRFPLTGGIDMAGIVQSSVDTRFKPGDRVLATGSGLGETLNGGYAELFRSDGDILVPIPEVLSNEQAMRIGTAGFTAALAIHRMEQNDQQPDQGPIVVTGATGGVGSLAIDMLSGAGYEVVAVTGKAEEEAYLRTLGASRILIRGRIDLGKRPLEKALWAGAIDNLGGDHLTWLTRTTQYGGNIASIGLAASHRLETTVMPFILRAISLLGINSVDTPLALRHAVWQRLATDLAPRHLDVIGERMVEFSALGDCFDSFLKGDVRGRVVVRIDENS